MKTFLLLLTLILPGALFADAQRAIRLKVQLLDYRARQCKGCELQSVILWSGSAYSFRQQCGAQWLSVRLRPEWSGDWMSLSVTELLAEADGSFTEGFSTVVSLGKNQWTTVENGGYRFKVYGEEYWVVEKEPNQAPEPTRANARHADAPLGPRGSS